MLQRTLLHIAALAASTLLTSSSCVGSSLAEPAPGAAADPAPAMPAPSTPTPHHQPFTLYDSGPPEAHWKVSPEEQALLDKRNREVNWDAVHGEFAAASAELAQRAKLHAAVLQIGLEDLSNAGVVR